MSRSSSLSTRLAAVAFACSLAIAGAPAAVAQDTGTPDADAAQSGMLDQLGMLTNPSTLSIKRNADGTWDNSFVNATGEPVVCLVHLQPKPLAHEILDWIIAHPDETKESAGFTFDKPLDAKIEESNQAGRGALALFVDSTGTSTEPQKIAFETLPTDPTPDYAGIALCKTGDFFGDGSNFIELSPAVSPVIGSIAGMPLGSLETGSLASMMPSDGGSIKDMVDADLIWDGGSVGSLASGS